LVTREFLGSVVPVGNEFILQTLLVAVESIGHVQSFRRSVVHSEVLSLAVGDKRVTILILSESIVSEDGLAEAEFVV
jgi:hypothetical protein